MSARSEAAHAVRGGVQLAASLIATGAVAIGIRVLLPRYLGPVHFGYLNVADALAATAFVFVGLGIDTYIRKEIPVRPEHASEFFGGAIVLRLAVAAAVFAGLWLFVSATGQPPVVRRLVFVFGAGNVLLQLNTSLAALLHARGAVGGLAFTNVASKMIWAGAVLAGIALGQPLLAVAIALVIGEGARCVALWVLVRRHARLRLGLDLGAAWTVVLASAPFYVNVVATTVVSRLDVTILSLTMREPAENGWYGAAAGLAGLALLVTPVIQWVLMPLFARAAARSEEELARMVARALETVLAVVAPGCLLLALGAEDIVGLAFGPSFVPAAHALRLLAGMVLLTYVASVSGSCLNLLGRGWVTTSASVTGLVVNLALNVVLIPVGARWLPDGGAGLGCAAAAFAAEALVVAMMTVRLGARTFDPRSVSVVIRTLGVCAAIALLDRLLLQPLGLARLAVDLALYAVLASAVGALRWREILDLVRSSRRVPRVASR